MDGVVLTLSGAEDLREKFREVDRGAQGREQCWCGTEQGVVWDQCCVGRHRIKDRAQEVTGVELIRDNVRVVCGETGQQYVDGVRKGERRGVLIREGAADVADNVSRRRA